MKLTRFIGFFLIFSVLFSCGKKAADFDSNFELFKNHISAFTSGFVSVKSDIRVQLAFNNPAWKLNQELDSDLLDISPSVSGKLIALSSNTIAFVPNEKLDQNTLYQVSLKLDKITNVPKELSEFNFSLKTIKQDFTVTTDDIQSSDKETYYMNGTLKTADFLEFDEVKELVECSQKGDDLNVIFDKENSSTTEFKFRVEGIKRFDEASDITLAWDGDDADIDTEGKTKIAIPAKGDFKVMDIKIGDENNQSLVINFSDPLKKDQDFKGLVAIENTSDVKYATMGNVLKVYFNNQTPVQSEEVVEVTATEVETMAVDSAAAVVEAAAEAAAAVDVDTAGVALDTAAVAEPVVEAVADEEYEEEEYTPPVANTVAVSGNKLVEVFQGIKNVYGDEMNQNYSKRIDFDPINPAVKFVKNGTILPSSNNLKINFEAANLKKVDVKIYKIYKNNILQFLQDNELNGANNLKKVSQPVAKSTLELKQNELLDYTKWNTYALDLSKVITPEPGAIYRVEFSFKKKYSLFKCAEGTDENNGAEDEEAEEDDVNYSGSGNYDYYYEEDYEWRESQDPCTDYYYYNTKVSTNILATDLGVIAKRGNNKSVMITVNDIVSTDPVAGVKVELYNYQQQKLAVSITDGDGMAQFDLKKYAYFAIVTKGENSTYVKLDDELSLSVSNFDVSGATLQKGLKGFIYGERGVWRPGDSIHLSFILNDKANKIPANHPIKFRLNDPTGKTIYQTIQKANDLNHYKFGLITQSSAVTGNWEAMVSVGGAQFYKSVKIETIKPNRLKIKNSFNEGVLSASKKNVNTVQVLWMHGAVAKDLKTEVQAKFSQQVTAFKGYDQYVFDDPTRNFSTEEINVYSGKVNQEGKVSFPINPSLQGQAPGMLNAAFITKVYENGGDVSTDVSSVKYSPYPTYVGIKAPEPNKYGLLETGKNNHYEFVTLGENGRPKSVRGLEVKVYKVDSRWWWDESSDNLSSYSTGTSTTTYKSFVINTDASGRGSLNFSVPEQDWGRYLIRAIDPNDGHASGQTVFLDYPYWSERSKNTEGKEATMLRFSTDKKEYAVGEKAKIFFPSSEGGRALISVENGSRVVKAFWAKTKKGETQVDLEITPDMTPNVYINLTMLQPHASTKNDSPIRMYGIVPISVVDKQTVLEPEISMPDVLRPEQKVAVKVSEKNGKAMTYTIAVVDEGLLDLTRFKTPNAWDNFYAREALGVRTWDIYDNVIGAYGGKVNQIFSIGGDQDAGGAQAKKANRFKPVVMYFGPFKLGKGDSKTHQIKLPKYIGSVKTMVVAANAENSAYGMAEKATAVKSPLMVLASLPRKISPSEKVTLPVTLFATEKHVKNVTVQVKTNSAVRLAGPATQKVYFASPDEKMAYFDLVVGNTTGIGKIQIIATSGSEKSVYDVEIDVMNPNPVTTAFTDATLGSGSSKTISWNSFGVAGSNKAMVEISSIPTIDFGRRLDYLIQYPHGCVEQTTSSVFPQLYLTDVIDLDASRKQSIQRNVSAAIERLTSFQLANGGFSYWPDSPEADDWGTSYAGHFLIEAEKKGYALPVNFKTKWIAYQQKMAKQWRHESQYQSDLGQAYRLYTLALAGSADLASMNRLRETQKISNESKLRLAAAYAVLKQNSAGLALLSKTNITESYSPYYYYSYGSEDRNRAMTLETLILLGQKQKAFAMAVTLAKNLSSDNWMSTQTTAYSLYAMAKFAKFNGGKGIDVQFTSGGKTVKITSTKAIAQRNLTVSGKANKLAIKNNKKNTLFVRVINSGILPVGQEKVMSNNVVAKVVFKDRKGNVVNVSKINQGTELIAEVILTNQKGEFVPTIALTQILPSGFEIVNTRYTDYGNATENLADFIDIRDDRANYYFGLKSRETRVFKMLINASYLGKYYLPGVQCEAMYDNSFIARSKGQWIEIVK
ncbi:alpha-2-macroglobulin family protein [Flavobacterium sp. GCM10023249]|uniref:alpha-2-macroglobulin family protein n=1 Tax=unclassified Flavobacterium TaxID=196869 RepID=UPI0036195F3E